MTTKQNDQMNASSELPPDLAAISAALDHLAHAERASTPPGLADRIYFRTAASLRTDVRRRTIVPTWGMTLRLAAVLGLAALGVIGALSALNKPSAPGPVPHDLTAGPTADDMIELAMAEQWEPISTASLADVKSELESLESALDSFWSIDADWLDEESL